MPYFVRIVLILSTAVLAVVVADGSDQSYNPEKMSNAEHFEPQTPALRGRPLRELPVGGGVLAPPQFPIRSPSMSYSNDPRFLSQSASDEWSLKGLTNLAKGAGASAAVGLATNAASGAAAGGFAGMLSKLKSRVRRVASRRRRRRPARKCPGKPPCSNKGDCNKRTGKCKCFEGWGGEQCNLDPLAAKKLNSECGFNMSEPLQAACQRETTVGSCSAYSLASDWLCNATCTLTKGHGCALESRKALCDDKAICVGLCYSMFEAVCEQERFVDELGGDIKEALTKGGSMLFGKLKDKLKGKVGEKLENGSVDDIVSLGMKMKKDGVGNVLKEMGAEAGGELAKEAQDTKARIQKDLLNEMEGQAAAAAQALKDQGGAIGGELGAELGGKLGDAGQKLTQQAQDSIQQHT